VTGPDWSLLIATATARAAALTRLLAILAPQAEQAAGRVEVVALRNAGGLDTEGLARIRQALLDEARGEWVSYADDDDTVEPDFIPAVLAAMAARPDAEFVAFGNRYSTAHAPGLHIDVTTGLRFGGWYDNGRAAIRDITHINPVRAATARAAGGFTGGHPGEPEDRRYVGRLRAALAGRPEAAIDRILYHYHHDPACSVQFRTVPHADGGPLPAPPGPWFRWHPASC
jgi:glycosyl transferase family 2